MAPPKKRTVVVDSATKIVKKPPKPKLTEEERRSIREKNQIRYFDEISFVLAKKTFGFKSSIVDSLFRTNMKEIWSNTDFKYKNLKRALENGDIKPPSYYHEGNPFTVHPLISDPDAIIGEFTSQISGAEVLPFFDQVPSGFSDTSKFEMELPNDQSGRCMSALINTDGVYYRLFDAVDGVLSNGQYGHIFSHDAETELAKRFKVPSTRRIDLQDIRIHLERPLVMLLKYQIVQKAQEDHGKQFLEKAKAGATFFLNDTVARPNFLERNPSKKHPTSVSTSSRKTAKTNNGEDVASAIARMNNGF